MKKYWLIIYLLLFPSILLAKDFWRVLDQISYSAIVANFVGEVEVSSDNKQLSSRYKIYFKENDGAYTVMRIVSSGKDGGEFIKTDSNVSFYSDSKEGLLRTHFLNFSRYPNFLPSNPSVLQASYALDLGKIDKIANKDCQWYWLSPKDNKDYYSIGFCADKENYFPLSHIYKDSITGEVVERINFTQISYQPPSDSELRLNRKYKFNNSMKNPMSFSQKINFKGQVNDDLIENLPNNFYIISEKDSANKNFRYYYLSDGLVYLSLFISPSKGKDGSDLKLSKVQIKRANIYGPINQIEYTSSKNKIVLIGDMSFEAMKQFILDTKFRH